MSRPSHSSSQQSRGGQGRGHGRGRGRGHANSNAAPARGSGSGVRSMAYIASVSRSSGLEKDGNDLKKYKIQEEYRQFIEGKLDTFWIEYAANSRPNDKNTRRAQLFKNNQENILILFRKLREGIFSSNRRGSFALEAYETSMFLSVVFDSPVQTTSIISHLVPDLYHSSPPPYQHRQTATLISLLHSLLVSYPSQRHFYESLGHLVPNLLEKPSDAHTWITSLAQSLRSMNYVRLEELTRTSSLLPFLENPQSREKSFTSPPVGKRLPDQALLTLVNRLRNKVRDRTWTILRSTYRELYMNTEGREWLSKSLAISSTLPGVVGGTVEEWTEKRHHDGHIRPKDGADERWIVCKMQV